MAMPSITADLGGGAAGDFRFWISDWARRSDPGGNLRGGAAGDFGFSVLEFGRSNV
jgi:hypothetical protein